MKAVWKYQMPNGRAMQCLQMPKGAQVLRLEAQRNVPVMYVLVDPNAPMVARHFEVVLTGAPFSATGCAYIGTAQLEGGSFVVHVFEVLA